MSDPPQDVRKTYDTVASRYAEVYADDLADKILDRALLAAFAETIQRAPALVGRLVGDLGCGPGFEARHLAGLGLDVLGIDLSANMISEAQRRHADVARLEFRVGSLLALPLADAALAGAIAFYSLIHLDPPERPLAHRELARVIRPGGPLLTSVHVSAADFPAGSRRRMSTWWDQEVACDGYFLDPDELIADLARVGFTLTARLERGPSTPHEFPSRRAYLLLTRDA